MTVFHPRAVPSSGMSNASVSVLFTAAVTAVCAVTEGSDAVADGKDKCKARRSRMAKVSNVGARSGALSRVGMTAMSDELIVRGEQTGLTVQSLEHHSHFLLAHTGALTPFQTAHKSVLCIACALLSPLTAAAAFPVDCLIGCAVHSRVARLQQGRHAIQAGSQQSSRVLDLQDCRWVQVQ